VDTGLRKAQDKKEMSASAWLAIMIGPGGDIQWSLLPFFHASIN
jgi:hypothetical protein